MAATTNEADVILNRINVSLARSQRLINSWLPPRLESQAVEESDEEDDFKSMTEIGGLGSKAAYAGDDSLQDGSFQRKKLTSNDKLLEQLLGKKAAQARKRSQDVGKSMSASKHAAPKQLATRPKTSREAESEDEEEGGRAAVFDSKQRKNHAKSRSSDVVVDDQQREDVAGDRKLASTERLANRDPSPQASSDAERKPAKRKATSYLDEILAQKANKKSKKKKSKGLSSN